MCYAITKLHTTSHILEIEHGRYNKMSAHLSFCPFCLGCIGDETHFLMNCNWMTSPCLPASQIYVSSIQSFNDMSILYVLWTETQKFQYWPLEVSVQQALVLWKQTPVSIHLLHLLQSNICPEEQCSCPLSNKIEGPWIYDTIDID